MNVKKIKLTELKSNPNNPRVIKDDKFHKLVASIKEFPEMLDIRPIVVNKDMIVLGGNMRLKACKEAGLKTVPVVIAENLSQDQQRQFIIKDNVGFGEWDWEMIANQWDSDELTEWGMNVPKMPEDVDYSLLDDESLDEKMDELTDGVKKAIQIEFNAEHYEEASELIKFWREKELYIGGFIMEKLKEEKEKL